MLVFFALLPAITTACPVDLSGSWVLDAGYHEGYTITASGAAEFHAACSSGPCTSWKSANLSVTLPSAIAIVFDSGLRDKGGLDASCARIVWSSSSWLQLPAPRALTVHLCPHAHTDPGWESTIEQLYTSEVHKIFDGVIKNLLANPNRTFNVEIAVFFQRYWTDLTAGQRETVRGLVRSGQLEFVGAGWSQNDEAAVRFEDTADQMTLGFLWVASALGQDAVKVAWQADPFGHSNTQVFLYNLLGMQLFVFGRPMQAADPSLLESYFSWNPTVSFAANISRTVLTHQHGTGTTGYWEPYRTSHGALFTGDVSDAVNVLMLFISDVATRLPTTSNILVMFGDDFAFQDADLVFPTIDKVIAAINANPVFNVKIKYSTTSRFVAALQAESHSDFPLRPSWDMFPLLQGEFPRPWTGFFTSLPEFKALFHAASAVWRGGHQLASLTSTNTSWPTKLAGVLPLWESVSLVQHHDAITGDGFGFVMDDYAGRLYAGISNFSASVQSEVGSVCFNATQELCGAIGNALLAGNAAFLSAFNPTSWTRDTVIEIAIPAEVTNVSVDVVQSDGGFEPVTVQMALVLGAVTGNVSLRLLSFAALLPPHGYVSFRLSPQAMLSDALLRPQHTIEAGVIVLNNSFLTATFSASTGALQSLQSADGAIVPVSLGLFAYLSAQKVENAWDFAGDDNTTEFTWPASAPVLTTGALYDQLFVSIDASQGISVTFRLFYNEARLRLITTLGPLVLTNMSVDTIMRVSTPLVTNGTFYTDSNGLEFVTRVRDARPWFNGFYPGENGAHAANNYYPITAAVGVRDVNTGVALLVGASGTSQGASSMHDGVVEVMPFRQVLDGATPGTGNRLVTVASNYLAIASSWAAAMELFRPTDVLMANPVLLLSSGVTPPTKPLLAPFRAALPPNLQIVTLLTLPASLNVSSFMDDTAGASNVTAATVLLVRVRHIFAANESPSLSVPVDINLVAALAPQWMIEPQACGETTLDGSHVLQPVAPTGIVSLAPLDLKTFVCAATFN